MPTLRCGRLPLRVGSGQGQTESPETRVTFEEAQTAFADENAILLPDPDHSVGEERFYLLGLSARLRVMVVIHCYRVNDAVIRLISARNATPSERVQYDARWIT